MRRTSDVLVLVYSHIQNIPEVSVTQNNILRIYCKHLSHLILLSDWLNTGLSHACRLWKHMRRITTHVDVCEEPHRTTLNEICVSVYTFRQWVCHVTQEEVWFNITAHTQEVCSHTHTQRKRWHVEDLNNDGRVMRITIKDLRSTSSLALHLHTSFSCQEEVTKTHTRVSAESWKTSNSLLSSWPTWTEC